ncbi:MAG: hypothetical protein V8S98_01570 [Lachnospiraceae bacterium]
MRVVVRRGIDNGLCGGTKREGKKRGNFMRLYPAGVEIKQKNIALLYAGYFSESGFRDNNLYRDLEISIKSKAL